MELSADVCGSDSYCSRSSQKNNFIVVLHHIIGQGRLALGLEINLNEERGYKEHPVRGRECPRSKGKAGGVKGEDWHMLEG